MENENSNDGSSRILHGNIYRDHSLHATRQRSISNKRFRQPSHSQPPPKGRRGHLPYLLPRSVTNMPILASASPYRTLAVTFVAWKALLLAIAAGSHVGPLYDTSSSLLTLSPDHDESPIRNLVTRLCSWDAIYFIKNAQRGYLFEQEWAFGAALPAVISFVIRCRFPPLFPHPGASSRK